MSKLRWIILFSLLIILLFGCATYTSSMGFEKISLTENANFKETRYKVILEEKQKAEEEARLAQEKLEAELKAQEERIIKERLAEEERIKAEKLAEEARIEAEKKAEAERLEAERLAEEARLAEEERIQAEKEAERLRLEAEEKARLEAERLEAERLAEEARLAEEQRIQAEKEAERLRLEAEEKARLEAERIEAKRKAREAAFAQSLAKARRLNAYPQDITSMNLPHIYRPVDEQILKDDSFTKLDVLFIPLGQTQDIETQVVADSIKDINVDFIFITGSLSDRVELSKALGKDTVTFKNGSIIFNSSIIEATDYSAKFKVSESKDIELCVYALSQNGAVNAKSVSSWMEYINAQSEKDSKEVLSSVENLTDSEVIFALSSSQPSSLDWTIFTPYQYRTDASFTISDELNKDFSDTYRATHFSEETDGGITFISPKLSERLDFLYTKGLLEVSSTTLAVAGLSNKDVARFAILATYIVP